MSIDVPLATDGHFVYLKTNAFQSENGITVDTIPLKCESIQVNVTREIPTIKVPTGIPRGESTTIAIDLGMGSKSISLSGIITNTTIKRSHTGSTGNYTAVNMTALETAQLISSGVDSSALAKYQNFNELVFLIESNVDENYVERGSVTNIPFSFSSRGGALSKDNARVIIPKDFPTSSTSTGVNGFIESFDFTISSDTPTSVAFNMSFKVATTFP